MSTQLERSKLHNTLWKITHELCRLADGLIPQEVLEVWDMLMNENGKMMDESFQNFGAMTKNQDGAALDKLIPPAALWLSCFLYASYV